MIYLISTDGYEPMMNHYATNEAEITAIVAKYHKDYFYEEIRNVKIDFESNIVEFEYKAEWDDEWEVDDMHIHPIERVMKKEEKAVFIVSVLYNNPHIQKDHWYVENLMKSSDEVIESFYNLAKRKAKENIFSIN